MPMPKLSLKLDPAAEVDRIVHFLCDSVVHTLRRRGAVVGISGGIDSSVVFSLCVRAFGPQRVVALTLPERHSSPESLVLARDLAAGLGVTPINEDLTGALDGFGCYRRLDEAVKRVCPEYDAARGFRFKIVLPADLLESGSLNAFSLTVLTPDGEEIQKRLPIREYLQIVAASNFKQRTRMSMLFYHAELNNYAVIGTANRNERDQGFFVKYGDGGIDTDPIVHLYKTQVYQLAEYLGVPEAIRRRTPTSDTYSAPCSQEEFFFRLPFETMDLIARAVELGLSTAEIAREMNLTEVQVQRVVKDLESKRRATEPLRLAPLRLDVP
jgi:NAD+ synthase